jgi:flagellin
MSFRINTNVDSMNALRNLGATSNEYSKSITRLSTGLRINSAADDPAGLIASEGFRAQIVGIDQAIKNSQDAINYAKTAEGALDEVNRLLRDARTLAVAAGNTGTLNASQIQANQDQLNSIASSISRIATNTQFGTKKLLDGSSGVNAAVSHATFVQSLNVGGTFGGSAVTANSGVVMTMNTAAEKAILASRDFGADDTATVGAGNVGNFTLNGVSFSAAATDTVNQLRDRINAASDQTGVIALTNGTGVITLQSTGWGANARIDLSDSGAGAGALRNGGAGTSSDTGVDAVAQLQIGSVTALFTGGLNGRDGITLSDTNGNVLKLTEAGNNAANDNITIGQVIVGSAGFQIGANAGQTTSLSLSNFGSSQLGTTAVSGLSMANLDISTASGATNALSVIDAAIDQVTRARGQVGSFQRNVMESNIRSLGLAKENLSATESNIRDADLATEMTNMTRLQILQQAGMSVLAQANASPQSVLSLLR